MRVSEVHLHSIHVRPPEVDDHLIPGHWEGDLIKGAGNRSSVGTRVERTSGFVVLAKMSSASAADALESFGKALKAIPEVLRKTLTYDQGKEMSYHGVDLTHCSACGVSDRADPRRACVVCACCGLGAGMRSVLCAVRLVAPNTPRCRSFRGTPCSSLRQKKLRPVSRRSALATTGRTTMLVPCPTTQDHRVPRNTGFGSAPLIALVRFLRLVVTPFEPILQHSRRIVVLGGTPQ